MDQRRALSDVIGGHDSELSTQSLLVKQTDRL